MLLAVERLSLALAGLGEMRYGSNPQSAAAAAVGAVIAKLVTLPQELVAAVCNGRKRNNRGSSRRRCSMRALASPALPRLQIRGSIVP